MLTLSRMALKHHKADGSAIGCGPVERYEAH